jgi:signal transduction histidine kinase
MDGGIIEENMDELIVGVVFGAVAGVVGFLFGRKTGGTSGGSVAASQARPSQPDPSADVGEAFRLALSRIGAYLRENVDAPLAAAFKDRSLSLRRAAEEAVAAIDDLHFFLEDPEGEIGEDDLTRIVKEAVQAFESEWDASVLFSSKGPVQARVNSESLLDALYLVLHNASVFGDGKGVVATVSSDGEWGRVLIQDEGPGFSAEALSRAYDPFYTTSEGGLGLGLSHARRAIELQAGRIHLRNRPDGGAEVEISVPLA